MGEDQKFGNVSPAFAEYVAQYNSGVVSSGIAVQIVFTKDAVDSATIGQETNVSLFSFSPRIKGTTFWVNSRTIEFRPAERLLSGQVYEVTFNLSRLMDVPPSLSDFKYSFQVIRQNFEVAIENIKPYIKTELKRQKVEGVLTTADYATESAVEQIVMGMQDGNSLKVVWTHLEGGKVHNFIVEDVTRKDVAGAMTLKIDGNSISVDRTEEMKVEIPALGDFRVMNARVIQTPSQRVVIQFSDPLKEKQELNGLISIPDLSALDFDIHDNEIWVYSSVRLAGSKTISIEPGIRNVLDYKMNTRVTWELTFEQLKPAVRMTGTGVILPSTDGLVLPFEAVSLNAVDVEIKKIYEKNVLQFLQVNNLSGNRELRRVGKQIVKKTMMLNTTGVTDFGKWNRYTLDLASLITQEPGAIYQVTLGFKKRYATYFCENDSTPLTINPGYDDGADEVDDETNLEDYGYDDEEGNYYYDGEYEWSERENPCHPSYYSAYAKDQREVVRNVLASDLGLIAKRGSDQNTTIFVTDIRTTKPLSGVQFTLYDYQQQVIGTSSSDKDGKAVVKTARSPFAVVATNGTQRGYLVLLDGRALSLSNFDVSGESIKKGLKGFLYGDRGVWRPGDSLYLTLILEDKDKLLPPAHPVVFEMFNPMGQLTCRLVRSGSENGFFTFATATKHDDPTGNWSAKVKVGGMEFSQPLKIETVKPNRLKINLNFEVERITNPNLSGKLDVKWLHGAPGKNLKAEFEVILAKASTSFKGFPDYTFEGPVRDFVSESSPAYSGYTDADGKAVVNVTLGSGSSAQGFLTAIFKGKVFEESGNYSIDRFSIPYSPFASYVGMKTPVGERYSGIIYTDSTHRVDIATVNQDGEGVSANVTVAMYKMDWRWWWDNSDGYIANYVSGNDQLIVRNESIRTVNGKGSWKFNMKASEWGRYLIRICNPTSGHCAASIVYVDEPGWSRRSRDEGEGQGATMLTFACDKDVYTIGEKINLTIPGSARGRALVSVESGSRIIETYWVETQAGETRFAIDAIPAMSPNVFVHVTLLQEHSQTVNDLPIRLYGVIAIRVEDPGTHLEPIITMPDVLEPGQEVTITVGEKFQRKMTYTVAMVDEGLLDITRFKTPDAWNRFYAREALGVRTWDLYESVMGAFGPRIERLLSVGGDSELAAKNDDPRANRFKPVVKFLGPFTIEKGNSRSHKFIMPQYIGSVRTMVVAGHEGAYGKAERATPVRKPLMVLATLPRVLGPMEKFKLPVTLFSQEKSIRNVKVDLAVTGPLNIVGAASQTVTMGPGGDLTLYFDMEVKESLGVAKVEVVASSGIFKGSDNMEIDVRNPNLPVSRVIETTLGAGKSWNAEALPVGMAGTNSAVLEVSNMPPINLGPRLRYLFQYPYGCVEQTISSVFPQLYLSQVKALTDTEQAATQRNVTAGIERLISFARREGGFAYWPGGPEADEWGSSYAGHFLIEAEAKGYYVPADMLRAWKKNQKERALSWRYSEVYYNQDLMQAYRLYTLACAGSAEIGAMNRMREMGNLSLTSLWMLGAAYARAGQPEAAKLLVHNLPTKLKAYRELGYSYGSDFRDKALIAETLVLLGEKTKAFEIVKELSLSLSNMDHWMSTQEVAFGLKAVTGYMGSEKRGTLKFTYTLNGKTTTTTSELPITQVQVPVEGTKKQEITMINESGGVLFARLIMDGTPARGNEVSEQNNLNVSVQYLDRSGVGLDPGQIEQGKQFLAEVTVTHPGIRSAYENLALAQVFPSGWEINNQRLDDTQQFEKSGTFTYQDIRDDRVYTYFNLRKGETKKFVVSLTATFEGNYYLPALSCEAMYDKGIYARLSGRSVNVIRPIVP